MQPLGVQVGVAYFLFLDTDMVNDSEREMPLLQRAKAEMPRFLSRTYPLPPAIDEVVAAIAERRRRVSYPRWFLKALAFRQLLASPLAERRSGKRDGRSRCASTTGSSPSAAPAPHPPASAHASWPAFNRARGQPSAV